MLCLPLTFIPFGSKWWIHDDRVKLLAPYPNALCLGYDIALDLVNVGQLKLGTVFSTDTKRIFIYVKSNA